MSARAGIVITGTEVLTGIIRDANGPWLSERLRERGVDAAHIMIVGDRPGDLRAALDFLAGQGVELIVTSGGLGPTADDLTAEVVAGFAGRPLVLDAALEARIAVILERLSAHWRDVDQDAMRAGNRKQAMVPEGAEILEPVGTAPGLVVAPAGGEGPTVLVLPGPPGELQPMWRAAQDTPGLRRALSGATRYHRGLLRLFGIPESEIARTLRDLEAAGVPLGALEITTCLRRGEIEIATLYEPGAAGDYARFADAIRRRHGGLVFSEDGTTVDEQVAALLAGPPARTIATAESCTGGLLAARLTEQPGSSGYVLGGVVVYSNAAKEALAGVPSELIERWGAVSAPVAGALADGARERFGAEVGVGVTGIAGPGGGTEAKPVGTVYVSAALADGARMDRRLQLPGSRTAVRERTTTVALHLLRRLLRGEDAGVP